MFAAIFENRGLKNSIKSIKLAWHWNHDLHPHVSLMVRYRRHFHIFIFQPGLQWSGLARLIISYTHIYVQRTVYFALYWENTQF